MSTTELLESIIKDKNTIIKYMGFKLEVYKNTILDLENEKRELERQNNEMAGTLNELDKATEPF